MTKPLTSAEKSRRYRERMKAARRRAALGAATASTKRHVPLSPLPLPDARKTAVRVTASGHRFTINRRGVSLAVIRGYYDG
jgi:hypothetical protein